MMINEPSTNIVGINSTKYNYKVQYPRASNLYHVCMRFMVIGTLNNLEATDMVHFNRQVTFDIGSALHKWIQNSDAYFGDQRRGTWQCNACGKVRLFGKPPIEGCTKCGADIQAMEYRELELLMHEPYRVTGHPDLFIEPFDAKGKIRVVELKTMSGDRFERLNAPLIEHVWQIQTYMWACHTKAFDIGVRIDNEYGYIVYITKQERKGEVPIKVFTSKHDSRVLKDIKSKLQLYIDGVDTGVLPPPDQTCKPDSWKERMCVAKKICRGTK